MKKYFLFSLLLIVLVVLTLLNVCNSNTYSLLLACIEDINWYYIIVLVCILFVYFLLQGLYMKIILNSLNTKISIFKGIYYSIVEFYFSGITPSSTGGQPVQLFYMNKDKITKTRATITLLLNTIYFKAIMVILGLFIIIFNNKYVFDHSLVYTVFFIIGLIADVFVILLCMMLLFNQKLIKSIFNKLWKFLLKFRVLKSRLENRNPIEIINNYKRETDYIKKHKKIVYITFLITFIQRLLYFSIAYFVCRGLGFSVPYMELLVIQVTVQLTLEMYPLPGGTVLSENMLRDIFATVIGIGIAEIGMLFTRLFVFYIPLIVCFLIIVIYTIKNRKKYL